MASKGFNYSVVSVDRVDADRICKPYQYLRSTFYEKRIEIYDAPMLVEELVGLERDIGTGKIDHTPSGINTKDIADALCGAVWRASKDADQFAFEYGEDLTSIVKENTDDASKEQVTIQLEEELKSILDPVTKSRQTNETPNSGPNMDFGLGAPQNVGYSPYISQGIMLWGD